MRVKIETYRGFEIMFETQYETFFSELQSWSKGSKSFAAIKKGIDEHIKDNSKFEPFWVIRKPSLHRGIEKLYITGIRKDARFVYEKNGRKDQLSEYDEKDYLLYNPDMENQLAKIVHFEILADEANKKLNEERAKITGTSLQEVKAKYLPQ